MRGVVAALVLLQERQRRDRALAAAHAVRSALMRLLLEIDQDHDDRSMLEQALAEADRRIAVLEGPISVRL